MRATILCCLLLVCGCIGSSGYNADDEQTTVSSTLSTLLASTSTTLMVPATTPQLVPTSTTQRKSAPVVGANFTEKGCEESCISRGYEGGQCDWDNFAIMARDWAKDVENIGPCRLNPYDNHCSGGCVCQCYNEKWDNFKVNFRTNAVSADKFDNNTWVALDLNNDGKLEGYCYTDTKRVMREDNGRYFLGMTPFKGQAGVYKDTGNSLPYLLVSHSNIIEFYKPCSIAETSVLPLDPYKSSQQESYGLIKET